jgi:hypothetical protein
MLVAAQQTNYQELPINANFDKNTDGFYFVQTNQRNYWTNNKLDVHTGNCLFITPNGNYNDYAKAASVSHCIKPVDFNSTRSATLSFDWRSRGNQNDKLEVFLVPADFNITAGAKIHENYKLGSYYYKDKVIHTSLKIDPTKISQNKMLLVFSWCNGNTYGTNPPASIDNVSITARTPNTNNDIVSLKLNNASYYANINHSNHTVRIQTLNETYSELIPEIKLPEFASIFPASGAAQDFTQDVQYTVTAENGQKQVWTVSVSAPNYQTLPINADFENGLDGFILDQGGQYNYWTFNDLDIYSGKCLFITPNGNYNDYEKAASVSHCIKPVDFNITRSATLSFDWRSRGNYNDNLEVYLISPDVNISAGEEINKAYKLGTYNYKDEVTNTTLKINPDKILQDKMLLVFSWSNGNYYPDSPPASIDNVKLTARTPNTNNDILSFKLKNASYETIIDNENHTVRINTLKSDYSDLIPEIKLPEFASISPASSTSQDFTQSVQYTVTAENGQKQIWAVTVGAPEYKSLPIEADFNTSTDGFLFDQGGQYNYWMYGQVNGHNGNCMYITDNGKDNQYSNSETKSHCIKPINFNGIRSATLQFDWKAKGVKYTDHLSVYLIPKGTEFLANKAYRLNTYSQSSIVNHVTIHLDESNITNDEMHLIFSWSNDDQLSSSYGPPASIDNIKLESSTPTGFENILNSELELYPNPVNEILNIEFNLKQLSEIKVEVFNSAGSQIWNHSLTTSRVNEKIPFANLPIGVYLIKITGGEETITKKVIKK